MGIEGHLVHVEVDEEVFQDPDQGVDEDLDQGAEGLLAEEVDHTAEVVAVAGHAVEADHEESSDLYLVHQSKMVLLENGIVGPCFCWK